MKRPKSSFFISAFIAVTAITASAQASPIVIFSYDFDGAPVVGSGVSAVLDTPGASLQSTQGLSGLGSSGNVFSGNFLSSYNVAATIVPGGDGENRATLTLTGLGAHTSIGITGLIAALDSWDGGAAGAPAQGDFFRIYVDGVPVFSDTYNQASGLGNNDNGLLDISNGAQHLGFWGLYPEQAFDLQTHLDGIAHTSSTLVIDIVAEGPGWQGSAPCGQFGCMDEAWGLDNLVVTMQAVSTGVPGPGALSLFCVGMIGLGLTRQKKS